MQRIRLIHMAFAMAVIGVLFGIAFSVTVAFFGILSMDGRFTENLKAAAAEGRLRVTGRHRGVQLASPGRSAEADARLRGLQEEIKVMQRLMERARKEREAFTEDLNRSREDAAALRSTVTEGAERVSALELSLQHEANRNLQLSEELSARCAELARRKTEARDLETELSVAQSGAGWSGITGR